MKLGMRNKYQDLLMKKYNNLNNDKLNWRILDDKWAQDLIPLLLKMIDSGNHWMLGG